MYFFWPQSHKKFYIHAICLHVSSPVVPVEWILPCCAQTVLIHAKEVVASAWRARSGMTGGAEHFGITELLPICLWQDHFYKWTPCRISKTMRWGVCLQKQGHLQPQTVCRGNAMTNFWVYVLFFVRRRLLRRAEQICRMLSRCHKFLSAHDRTIVIEVWASFQHRPHNSSKLNQSSAPCFVTGGCLACSEHWQN